MQIHRIGIRDSPDHRSVRDKEVYTNLLSLSGTEILCPLSVLQIVRVVEDYFKRKYEMIIFSGHWKLSEMER